MSTHVSQPASIKMEKQVTLSKRFQASNALIVMDQVPETWVLEVPWRNGFEVS